MNKLIVACFKLLIVFAGALNYKKEWWSTIYFHGVDGENEKLG